MTQALASQSKFKSTWSRFRDKQKFVDNLQMALDVYNDLMQKSGVLDRDFLRIDRSRISDATYMLKMINTAKAKMRELSVKSRGMIGNWSIIQNTKFEDITSTTKLMMYGLNFKRWAKQLETKRGDTEFDVKLSKIFTKKRNDSLLAARPRKVKKPSELEMQKQNALDHLRDAEHVRLTRTRTGVAAIFTTGNTSITFNLRTKKRPRDLINESRHDYASLVGKYWDQKSMLINGKPLSPKKVSWKNITAYVNMGLDQLDEFVPRETPLLPGKHYGIANSLGILKRRLAAASSVEVYQRETPDGDAKQEMVFYFVPKNGRRYHIRMDFDETSDVADALGKNPSARRAANYVKSVLRDGDESLLTMGYGEAGSYVQLYNVEYDDVEEVGRYGMLKAAEIGLSIDYLRDKSNSRSIWYKDPRKIAQARSSNAQRFFGRITINNGLEAYLATISIQAQVFSYDRLEQDGLLGPRTIAAMTKYMLRNRIARK